MTDIYALPSFDAPPDLADRLRRLADEWAHRVPPHHQRHAAVAVDRLAVLLGELVADAEPRAARRKPTANHRPTH